MPSYLYMSPSLSHDAPVLRSFLTSIAIERRGLAKRDRFSPWIACRAEALAKGDPLATMSRRFPP